MVKSHDHQRLEEVWHLKRKNRRKENIEFFTVVRSRNVTFRIILHERAPFIDYI